MNEPAFDKLVRDTLVWLSDDWFALTGMAGLAKVWLRKYGSSEPSRDLVERVVRHLVERGLVVVGELSGPRGRFEAWNGDLPTALDRIRREWNPEGTDTLEPFTGAWFDGTAAGIAEGRRLLPELSADPDVDE